MGEDRRSQARYPCLIAGEMRPSAGGFCEVVCTSISRGGAFLACRSTPPAGSKVIVELRPYGSEGPTVEVSGVVVWSSPRGAATPPGCGLRWHSLRCSHGPGPLKSFAAEHLRWQDLGNLPIDPLGSAWLRLDHLGKLSAGFIAEMAQGSLESHPTAAPLNPPTDPERRNPLISQALTAEVALRDSPTLPVVPTLPDVPTLPVVPTLPDVPTLPVVPTLRSSDAEMGGSPTARAARAVESGLVPLVPAGLRKVALGKAPLPVNPAQTHGHPRPSLEARPLQGHGEPTVALRRGPVHPALQHWPAGVPRGLSSKYRQLQLLGRGSHGVVYRAREAGLERDVVLKLVLRSSLGSDMAYRALEHEAKLVASLNHPHIVQIYDVGEADGVLWYAMEYVDGVPLSKYLIPGKPLANMSFRYAVFSQLCEALDYAHSQGMVHCQVKPENVLVAVDGTVKLYDFALARGKEDGTGHPSLPPGAPYYMAPEQLTGGHVTKAADAYALGVLLYRLMTGEVPFSKGNISSAHVLEPVPDPRLLQPALADAAAAVMTRLLAKRPEERYAECRQAAADLWQACFGQGIL